MNYLTHISPISMLSSSIQHALHWKMVRNSFVCMYVIFRTINYNKHLCSSLRTECLHDALLDAGGFTEGHEEAAVPAELQQVLEDGLHNLLLFAQ